MKKVQSFIKKHKKGIIIVSAIVIVLIICAVALYQLIAYLSPNQKQSQYGDRCESTESVMITDARKEAIKEAVESYENMTLSTIDVKCNLIDIIVIVDDSVLASTVKEMSDKVLEAFSEEELKYYDLSLWVDSEAEESETYPMIGTRHKEINGEANAYFVW